MTVGLSTTAIFGYLGGYFFGNFRDKASDILHRYATPCRPVIGCKMNSVGGIWTFKRKIDFDRFSRQNIEVSIFLAPRYGQYTGLTKKVLTISLTPATTVDTATIVASVDRAFVRCKSGLFTNVCILIFSHSLTISELGVSLVQRQRLSTLPCPHMKDVPLCRHVETFSQSAITDVTPCTAPEKRVRSKSRYALMTSRFRLRSIVAKVFDFRFRLSSHH